MYKREDGVDTAAYTTYSTWCTRAQCLANFVSNGLIHNSRAIGFEMLMIIDDYDHDHETVVEYYMIFSSGKSNN